MNNAELNAVRDDGDSLSSNAAIYEAKFELLLGGIVATLASAGVSTPENPSEDLMGVHAALRSLIAERNQLRASAPQWQELPDGPGWWWYLKKGAVKPEMVEGRELSRGYVCFYGKTWGGMSLDLLRDNEDARELYAGQWMRVAQPELPQMEATPV